MSITGTTAGGFGGTELLVLGFGLIDSGSLEFHIFQSGPRANRNLYKPAMAAALSTRRVLTGAAM
jgi:hypothetical protein